MSRTHRLRKAKHIEETNKVCYTLVRNYTSPFRTWNWVKIQDPIELKRRRARLYSDMQYGYWNQTGPGWFYNLFAQKPYRVRARREISRWTANPDYEIILESKPRAPYWT